MSKFKNHVPIKQQIIYQQAESASLRSILDLFRKQCLKQGTGHGFEQTIADIEALLATTKLEKRPVQEEFLHSPRIDIAYNQGAEAQYAAIVQGLGGEK